MLHLLARCAKRPNPHQVKYHLYWQVVFRTIDVDAVIPDRHSQNSQFRQEERT